MRLKGRKGWLYALVIAVFSGMFAAEVKAAEEVEFHGYLEANIVLRDEDGAQYGFLDHLSAVHQRNTGDAQRWNLGGISSRQLRPGFQPF